MEHTGKHFSGYFVIQKFLIFSNFLVTMHLTFHRNNFDLPSGVIFMTLLSVQHSNHTI